MTEEDLAKLSDEDKETLRKKSEGLHEEMHQTVTQLAGWKRKFATRTRTWNAAWPCMPWGT